VPSPNAGIVALSAGASHSLAVVGFPRADLNCDRVINFDDVNPFVLALSDPAAYAQAYPHCDVTSADCNADGIVNFDDINAFVNLLSQ
jgi:hypothetical protein